MAREGQALGSLPPPSSGIICPVTPLGKPSALSSPAEAQRGQAMQQRGSASWEGHEGTKASLSGHGQAGARPRDLPPRKPGLPVSGPHIPCVLLENNGSVASPSAGRKGAQGRSVLPLNGACRRGLAPARGMAVWRQGQNVASLALCLLPARSVPSPGRLHRLHPCSLRQGPGHSPAMGERGSVAGGMERITQAGGGLGEPPAVPTCHATENHEGNERLNQPLCQSSSSQAVSEPGHAQSTHGANESGGKKGQAVLGSPVGTRGCGGGVGDQPRGGSGDLLWGLFPPSLVPVDLAATSGCLALGSGTDSENSFPGLFVFLEKFPSYSESRLGLLTGNTWWAVTGVEEDWGSGGGVWWGGGV